MQVGRAKPLSLDRMGSYIDWDDPSLTPWGLARLAKNMRYSEISAGCRSGLQLAFKTGVATSRTSGLGILNFKSSFVTSAPVTFTIARSAGAGTFAAARDVYVVATFITAAGESLPGPTQLISNTLLNDRVIATIGVIGFLANVAATGVNIYEASVATGAVPPGIGSFKKVAGGPFVFSYTGPPGPDVNSTVNIDTDAAGAAPPGADTSSSGNLDKNVIVQYGYDGTLWAEKIEGSGTLNQLFSNLVQFPAAAYAQMAQAQNRIHLAFGDLIKGTGRPCLVDSNNNVDPISYPLIGQAWEAMRYYNIGTIISPTTANGHLYRATVAGVAGISEPIWPTTDATTVVDNGATWKEFTPNAGTVLPPPLIFSAGVQSTGFDTAISAGAGAYAANRDVYILCTYVNGTGGSLPETTPSVIKLARTNTVVNDRIPVTCKPIPSWLSGLTGIFAVVGLNVYAADVATGAAAPIASAFHFIAQTAVGGTVNVDASGAGIAPPVTNTAVIGAVGNICAGTRNLVILQKNRNTYINGMTNAAVITFNVPAAGQQLWVGNIYLGPANCLARVIALTVAGDPTAGPYRYIGQNDKDVASVTIKATVINDNATTGAYLQFTDTYLPTGGVEVTYFFTKKEVPTVSDIYYSKTLARMIYTGDPANRSSHWISEATQLESILAPTNLLNVATQTKSACICAREVGGVLLSLKSDGGHIIQASTDDPNSWGVSAQWDGSGPCGPRAVDVFDSQDASAPGSFMLYWHDTGLYLYQGAKPVWVSEEMSNVIKRVNLAVKHLVWVVIDNVNRKAHIGLPLDGAVLPNKVLTVNYARGWNKSYEFYPRAHGYIAIPGRCWSLDDIQASSALVAQRNLTAPPDATITQQQLLFASSVAVAGSGYAATGDTWMEVPNYYSDLLDGANKTAIDQQYKFAYGPPRSSAKLDLKGVEMQGHGNGRINVTVTGSQINANAMPPIGTYNLADWVLTSTTVEQDYASGCVTAENYNFGLELTNKKTADAWFEIHHVGLFAQPRWKVGHV